MDALFLEELKKNNRIILQVGAKGSGKSTNILNFLHYAYANNMYKHYYLIIPKITFKNGNYDWILKNKNTTIYNGLNETVLKDVLKKCDGKENNFLFLEDATQYKKIMYNSTEMNSILTTSRWLKLTCWIILHSTGGVLAPGMRANCDFFICNKITNAVLLENIYEEFFSLFFFNNFKEFRQYFINMFKEHPYNGFFINTIDLKYEELKNMPMLNDFNKNKFSIKKEIKPEQKKTENKNFFSKLLLYNKNGCKN